MIELGVESVGAFDYVLANDFSSILTVITDNHTIPGEKGALTILIGQP